MAHPGFVIKQYVYHFLNQWNAGLQPSLTLNAKPNEEIAFSLNLTTSLHSKLDEEQCSPSISRHSGRRSRQRRRARRAAGAVAGASREIHGAGITFTDESEDQRAELENQKT